MAAFKLTEIIDGETIKVSPGWSWSGQDGDIVRIMGYKKPEDDYKDYIISKIKTLLEGNTFDLMNPRQIKEEGGNKMICCSVYLNGVDIATYFPELKTK